MKFLFLGGNRHSGRVYCGMILISKVFLEPFILIVSPATKLFIVIFLFTHCAFVCMVGFHQRVLMMLTVNCDQYHHGIKFQEF